MQTDKKQSVNPFINFLQSICSFGEGDAELFEEVLVYKHFKAGERVVAERSVCKNIYFLVKGQARSYFINHEGQEFTWNFHFNDGEAKFENYFLVDYNSFLTQAPTPLNFEAIEDLETIMVSFESISKLTLQSKSLERVAGLMSAIAYQNVHKRTFTLLTLNAKERYVQLLKEEPYLLNKFQHYLVASYLGIAPQSMSRLRKQIFKS